MVETVVGEEEKAKQEAVEAFIGRLPGEEKAKFSRSPFVHSQPQDLHSQPLEQLDIFALTQLMLEVNADMAALKECAYLILLDCNAQHVPDFYFHKGPSPRN